MKRGIRSEEEGLQLLLGELVGLLHAGAAISNGCGNQLAFAVLKGEHLVLDGACSKRCPPHMACKLLAGTLCCAWTQVPMQEGGSPCPRHVSWLAWLHWCLDCSPAMVILGTLTVRVCPILWALSMACSSTVGFHHCTKQISSTLSRRECRSQTHNQATLAWLQAISGQA